MKRILVIDTAASSGGALTVLQDFYKAVCDSDTNVEWIFLLSGHYVTERENIKVIVQPELKSHIKRLAFDCITGRNFIKKINPDVVFSLQNTILMGGHVPQVVYVHQPVPFQTKYKFSFLKKEERSMAVIQYLLGTIIKSSIRLADLVIVQTKWMEQAVLQQCNIKKDKIVQIYPTVEKVQKKHKAAYHTTNTFFYPTSNAFYKNVSTLIEACKKLDSDRLAYNLNITIGGHDTDKIKYLGKISKDEVFWYYKESCLVFPSYIETFGYPLVEAKSAGSMILVSDCEFSHELLDDYENAYFFDPFNSDELYKLMKAVGDGNIIRKEPKESFDLYSRNSTWNLVIGELLRVTNYYV